MKVNLKQPYHDLEDYCDKKHNIGIIVKKNRKKPEYVKLLRLAFVKWTKYNPHWWLINIYFPSQCAHTCTFTHSYTYFALFPSSYFIYNSWDLTVSQSLYWSCFCLGVMEIRLWHIALGSNILLKTKKDKTAHFT